MWSSVGTPVEFCTYTCGLLYKHLWSSVGTHVELCRYIYGVL
jgi:hypothetical protein